uniref:Zinc finger PHD-type domain-containing protein n=1 Tax=Mycena chlorophos TaxID=658473 RepID=A0ABQ0L7N4_MYCCL|nr:predicted protein [Mycena chlorophos]
MGAMGFDASRENDVNRYQNLRKIVQFVAGLFTNITIPIESQDPHTVSQIVARVCELAPMFEHEYENAWPARYMLAEVLRDAQSNFNESVAREAEAYATSGREMEEDVEDLVSERRVRFSGNDSEPLVPATTSDDQPTFGGLFDGFDDFGIPTGSTGKFAVLTRRRNTDFVDDIFDNLPEIEVPTAENGYGDELADFNIPTPPFVPSENDHPMAGAQNDLYAGFADLDFGEWTAAPDLSKLDCAKQADLYADLPDFDIPMMDNGIFAPSVLQRGLSKEILDNRHRRAGHVELTIAPFHVSYAWSNNSCYIDSSLMALFATVVQDPDMLSVLCALPSNQPLSSVGIILGLQLNAISQSATSEPALSLARTELRSQLAGTPGIIGHESASHASTAFGWLFEAAGLEHMLQLPGSTRSELLSAVSLFQHSLVELSICSGSHIPGEHEESHWRIRREPRGHMDRQLTDKHFRQFDGDLQRWLVEGLMGSGAAAEGKCWREAGGRQLCAGSACLYLYTLALPSVLILEVVGSQDWSLPPELFPLHVGAAASDPFDPKFQLMAHVFRHAPPGGTPHFMTRYRLSDGSVYDYDGLRNEGNAVHRSDLSFSSMTGRVSTLQAVPKGFSVSCLVYQLVGGQARQPDIFERRINHCPFPIIIKPASGTSAKPAHDLPFKAEIKAPSLRPLMDHERHWLNAGHVHLKKYTEYATKVSLIASSNPSNTDGCQEMPPSGPSIESTFTLAPAEYSQVATEPLVDSDGLCVACTSEVADDGVACESCGRKAHIACVGLVRNDGRKQRFQFRCSACLDELPLPDYDLWAFVSKYKKTAGELYVIPKTVKWTDNTTWLPARLVSYNRSRRQNEYEFQWAKEAVWGSAPVLTEPPIKPFYRNEASLMGFPDYLRSNQACHYFDPLSTY